MNIKYQIIYRANLTNIEREIFADLLRLQDKVRGDLSEKADRCKFICITSIDDESVAIGGIKKKTVSDFSVEKANLSEIANQFEWELGYLFTKPNYTKMGIASNIVRLLIKEFGDDNLMTSTEISKNPTMVKMLESNGFRHYGKPWKSDIHENYLGLFLKYK